LAARNGGVHPISGETVEWLHLRRDKVTKTKFEQDLHKATSNEPEFPDESVLKSVTLHSYSE